MAAFKPLSFAAVRVLKAIADGTHHGFDIMDATGLPSGTVYPILARLEALEMVRARWEAVAIARRDKRPPRRYYEISAIGAKALAGSVEHYRSLGASGPLTPAPRTSRG